MNLSSIIACASTLIAVTFTTTAPAEPASSRMPDMDALLKNDAQLEHSRVLLQTRLKAPRNIHKLIALSPGLLDPLLSLGAGMRVATNVPRKDLELAILRTSQLTHGDYEFAQHRAIAISCGVTEEQVQALERWTDSALFDDRERRILGYIDASAGKPSVSDAAFSALRSLYSERQMLELTFVSAIYGAVAQITRSYQVPIDLPSKAEEYGRCQPEHAR